jgi:hypothetical protein
MQKGVDATLSNIIPVRLKFSLKINALIIFFVLVIMLIWVSGAMAAKYQPAKATFSVRCNDIISGYEIQGVFALPGEILEIEVLDANWHSQYSLQVSEGSPQERGARQWRWTVPEKIGFYTAQVLQIPSGHMITLNCFVMVPYAQLKAGKLKGYIIGEYPEPREIQSALYTPPRGFIEVTQTAMDIPVSPHFTLGQFVCKQPSGFPKYLVLDERLVVKLEALLERVNAQGYRCRTLGINCGFRTPFYNKQAGLSQYSSHLWGQAADIYVDVDGTGMMSDLDHNGKRDEHDVRIIGDMVESMEGTARHQDLVGGLGLYDSAGGHGNFVHVDVRGARARWEVGNGSHNKKNTR